jgi:flagellar M-ring protein FliF
LRLQVAADGFPSAGRIGFELFDKTTFGTTDAQEQRNFQRALQGELERTISTLSEVASARVHLTMAKNSLFSSQAEPAKAAVTLRLKTSRPLGDATVRGIQGLVANSVESLRPEQVTIVDTFGRQLTQADDTRTASAQQMDKQLQIEHDLSTKVVALLEPVVGSGHVRVNVSARLKGDAEEETEERWDPTTVVRSKQTNAEGDARTAASQGGVAGARANLPEGASAATPVSPAPQMNGTTRNSETTNYEVSKLTRHRLSPQGQLARLSVAVIVDDAHAAVAPAAPGAAPAAPAPPAKGTARTQEEMQRIQKIVSAAVGFDQQRGDQLTVENIGFDAPTDDVPMAPATWKQTVSDISHQYGMQIFRTVSILLLAILALFTVIRPMTKRAFAPAPRELAAGIAPGDRPRTIEEMEAAALTGTPAVALPMDAAHRLPLLARQVGRLATDEPEQLARIVRGWLAEEDH